MLISLMQFGLQNAASDFQQLVKYYSSITKTRNPLPFAKNIEICVCQLTMAQGHEPKIF